MGVGRRSLYGKKPFLKGLALLLFPGLILACIVPPLLARKKDKNTDKDQDGAPTAAEQRKAQHALNRLTFGPRPGDVQRVAALGADQWIDLQLHPDRVDDGALDARLEPLRTLRMSTKELAENFPDGQELNQVMNGKRPMPSDPARRMVYQVQIERHQERKEKKEIAGRPPTAGNNGASPASWAAASMSGANDSMTKTESGNDLATNAEAVSAEKYKVKEKSGTEDENMMSPSAQPPGKATPEDTKQARLREEKLYADLQIEQGKQQEVQKLPELPPDQRFKKILSMQLPEQVEVADSLRGGKGQNLLEGLNPRQKETLLALNNPQGVVVGEMAQAKLLRAVYSERQFEEVMTDFWFNHFNVFVDKGLDHFMVTSYERDVIRPHALGRFEDLLVATAKSPAMLFYLDNWLSVGPNSAQALGLPQHPNRHYYPRPGQKKRNQGLNENYGRELLELHTLSVNGGYSQRDVTEVAKVFTGWTIEKPAEGGGFKFDPRMHEPGPKFVLGKTIKPKGEGEGLEMLHRLATSPQTAHFISLKLAERFVSDDPPPAIVDRMAKTFLKKKGDIREVLLTCFHSPEFWDDATYRTKVKTPLEFVASAVRATGAEIDDALPLTRQLNNMGMPLYAAQPPTGYSMKAETWVSSSALLNRMNFALALTNGKVKGVKLDAAQLVGGAAPSPDPTLALSLLEGSLLDGDVSKQTHDSITAQIEAAEKNGTPQKQENKPAARKPDDTGRSAEVNMIAGLLLGSPEFQRR
jgi:uncharacterized protein (DUF1800 family)